MGILLRAKLPESDNWQHELSDEWYSKRERSILEFMLSYADIVDWFVEFLFGCMSELLTLNNRKETKRLPLQLPYPQALGSEYKLVSDGPVALTILRS